MFEDQVRGRASRAYGFKTYVTHATIALQAGVHPKVVRLVLPKAYVGEHVHHGYARTAHSAHSAQGSTIDQGLFAPTATAPSSSATSPSPAAPSPTACTP